ncbi:autotransporter outer membrane beta-barrel domain-containing protein [Pandoraea sputorum]|uniref:Outer membrane autotransporter n=1 Tax=Pandoraea sputorum TaxID=93222 RepID=A0A5E5BIT1_9BURK|nr:autotransporter outer membrane beta-barrel domain-containing protein [Pandoraea sputorum]VVE84453.1 outer membrane autotransporter [Pandoraea sputorum]
MKVQTLRMPWRAACATMTMTASAAFLLMAPDAQAIDVRDVEDANGVPILRARIYGTGDGIFGTDAKSREAVSAWDLSQDQVNAAVGGMRYWTQMLKAAPGQALTDLNVGTIPETDNAYATSPLAPAGGAVAPLQLQAALQNREAGDPLYGAYGQFVLGRLPFSTQAYVPSPLARGTAWDLAAVVSHEVAHAMGISTTHVERGDPSAGRYQPEFAAHVSEFTAHLRDDNGQPARPGQAIYCQGCVNPPDAIAPFDVRAERAHFVGAHVDEVLAGSGLPGVPVRVTSYDAPHTVNVSYLDHLELKNSLMSHQRYRNYTGFMEAELAVMQDLGYVIDRRNFFGRSIYGDAQVLVNDAPYLARNADGTAYLPNTYNSAIQGLGLHVYGSANTIYQRADVLTSGAGGGGIRVDGAQNHLIVLPGTRIYADGAYARGVMFAYGRDHTFTQRGDVQALGEHGIAASFDFGNNSVSNADEYRGSYLRRAAGQAAPLLPELDGPLVSTFDLTGRLAGRDAAIYLSENGYVGQINVMRGAALTGNVVSEYAQYDATGALRLTQLTFGQAADADGRATGFADPDFRLQYSGNIMGRNLSLQWVGGTSLLSGDHLVHDASVAPGATLMGNGSFTLVASGGGAGALAVSEALNTPGQFTNHGTVAPLLNGAENRLTVNGDYVQTPSGTLQLELNAAKTLSQLSVNGHATLDGTLAIAPQRGWYARGFGVAVDEGVSATTTSGRFANVTGLLDSPTLHLAVVPQADARYAVTVARTANAYSRYGADANSQQVGGALDRLADTAAPAMQPLVVALDFSAADGSEVRRALGRLSPSVYGAMFTGALLRERQVSALVADAAWGGDRGRDMDTKATPSRGDWRAFAVTFGAGYWRGGAGDQPGANGNAYGVVFGAERGVPEARAWTLGVHGAVSGQSTRLDGAAVDGRDTGKTTALDVGVQARYAAETPSGPHAFAVVRVGIEDGRVDRAVAIPGYLGSARGTWTGTTAAASLGGGWRWALSPTLSVGPIVALDYTSMSRPGETEAAGTGDGGVRLALDAQTFQSLRSRVGAELRFALPAAPGNVLRAHLQASWNHEFLGGAVTQGAAFVGAPAARFATRTQVVARDSVTLQAGLTYRLGQRMTVGAAMASNLYRSGDADLAGSVSATWRY